MGRSQVFWGVSRTCCHQKKQNISREQSLFHFQCAYSTAVQGNVKLEQTDAEGYSNLKDVKPFAEIPGPRGLPYFGTLFHYKYGRYPKEQYHKSVLENYHKYGNIFKETIAGHTRVHLFDPDEISVMYQLDGKSPHVPPLLVTSQLYRRTHEFSPGLGNINGEEWYRLRSAVRNMMMRPKAASMFLPQVSEVMDDFIARLKFIWNERTGQVENFMNEVLKWQMESSANTCFDTRLHCLEAEKGSLHQSVLDADRQIFEQSVHLQFGIPLYKIISTPTWKKLTAAEDLIMGHVQGLVDETVGKIQKLIANEALEEDAYSFMTYLIGREELSYKDISILSRSMFTDGLSTTVPSVIGQIYCLASNPEKQAKLYEHIQRVAPDRDQPVTNHMINGIPYLKACIREGFRFFPVGSDVSRFPQKDIVIGGYRIPAGTHVDLNNNLLLRLPEYFSDPDEYYPERWMKGESSENVHPYLLLPFSTGPRNCAGKRFAEQEMQLLLIRLLQNFEISWPHGEPMSQHYCVLMTPDKPAQFKFTPRK